MNAEEFVQRDLSRRQFLGRSAQNAAGVAAGMVGIAGATSLAKSDTADRVRCGIIGVRNQGKTLATGLAALPDAQVVAVCDVDENVLPAAVQAVQKIQGTSPRTERDFRRLLDDPKIDAVVIATPDHWHASMTVLACSAGKDVYVETPACHIGGEGPLMIEAARKHGRIVTVGMPQRSGAHFQSAVRVVQSGQIGNVSQAKAWFVQRRQPLAPAVAGEPPLGVDFENWLGPAPQHPFVASRFHYHWRWMASYGSGELGQWGSQLLDVARWGLNIHWPQRVIASVGSRVIADDAETPDALTAQFQCGEKLVTWEHRTWTNHAPEGRTAGVAFLGDRGTLVVDRGGWKVYDSKESLTSNSSEFALAHLADFVNAVKTRNRPTADIEVAHVSAGWCHLARISQQLEREVRVDVTSGAPLSTEAQQLWNPDWRQRSGQASL